MIYGNLNKNQMIVKQAQAPRDLFNGFAGLARVQDHAVELVQLVKPKTADLPGSQVAQQSWCGQQEWLGQRPQANADLFVAGWSFERVAKPAHIEVAVVVRRRVAQQILHEHDRLGVIA